MSTYTHLIDNIVRSVKDTPFVFDLIADPIRISADDIFDVTSFTEDLVETFEKLSLCVNPQDIIQIDDPISGEPILDSWDSDEDDEELDEDEDEFDELEYTGPDEGEVYERFDKIQKSHKTYVNSCKKNGYLDSKTVKAREKFSSCISPKIPRCFWFLKIFSNDFI